jgi:hypothetical protein
MDLNWMRTPMRKSWHSAPFSMNKILEVAALAMNPEMDESAENSVES